jgi:hypothetical protein
LTSGELQLDRYRLLGLSRLVGGSHLSGIPKLQRASTHLCHEDFYRAYVNSRIAFKPQRVCQLEALVEVVGEQLRPHLSFLPGLSDFLGRIGAYCGTWVREFYSSLLIDPAHEFIHFAF